MSDPWTIRLVIAGTAALLCLVAFAVDRSVSRDMDCINEDDPDWMEGE